METILTTENLCKTYNKSLAVNNIYLNIPKGKIYGLLGPNGAGKSTTLKMITGIITPTSGKILINNQDWNRNYLNKIGSLIETPPLYDNLTAYENLKVKAILTNTPLTRINEVLTLVNLKDTGKKKASQFSFGMKQRLGIALALLTQPDILILDEPTNGLDPIGIEELRQLIKKLSNQGTTVILSSHILSEVKLLADYIGIISNGILGYQGTLDKQEDLEELFMKTVNESIGA